uniref:Transthyretin n=1 Tax=Salmo trutta TaxID=8032 RepID=A0A673WCU4_SALTR
MVKSVTICLYWCSQFVVFAFVYQALCMAGYDCVYCSDAQCPLMVKILDAVKGVPAGSMALSVSRRDANGMIWAQVASRYHALSFRMTDVTSTSFGRGCTVLSLTLEAYWKSQGTPHFHKTAEVVFEAHAEGHRHYTLALLRSPFSYTTTAVVINIVED